MKANLVVGTLTMLVMASIAAAREIPPPDVRKDTRAPVTEQVASDRVTIDEIVTCSTGQPVGWLAAVAAVGLLARRRSSR